MKNRYIFSSSLCSVLLIFPGLLSSPAFAQQTDRPLELDLNVGGGLIGNSSTNAAFQPEIALSYMPGNWGFGLTSGFYSFESGFHADQYRAGFEQFTQSTGDDEKWNTLFINAGPRYQFGSRLPVTFTAALDLAISYQNPPDQKVEFYYPDREPGVDMEEVVLAEMEAGGDNENWHTALRPQMEIGLQPFRSNRIGFSVKTGVQYALSQREITYSQRDLSDVMSVDNAYEMHSQFENAPVVQRTEPLPRANFFVNAGIKISFGGSRAAAPGQDYNSSRSNKPSSEVNDDISDIDSDDDGVETAQDYNSSRSNKPSSEAPDDDRGGVGGLTRLISPGNPNRVALTDDESFALQAMVLNPEAVMAIGSASNEPKAAETGEDPLYEGEGNSGTNPLFHGEMSPANGDVADDVYPDLLVRSSFSISKRSARTGRSRIGDESGNAGDVEHLYFKVEINDPDADDDGVMDVADNATFSISQASEAAEPSRTDGSAVNWESGSYIEPQRIIRSSGDRNTEVLAWTYDISSLRSGDQHGGKYSDLMSGARLVVSQYTDEKSSRISWHFDLQINDFNDLDSDDDGVLDGVQNASFSISKRSARQ